MVRPPIGLLGEPAGSSDVPMCLPSRSRLQHEMISRVGKCNPNKPLRFASRMQGLTSNSQISGTLCRYPHLCPQVKGMRCVSRRQLRSIVFSLLELFCATGGRASHAAPTQTHQCSLVRSRATTLAIAIWGSDPPLSKGAHWLPRSWRKRTK